MKSPRLPFALTLAAIWGALWAAYLQFTALGQFLADRRTWITVVIGIGTDLAIALLILPSDAWRRLVAIISVSSVPIIARSLLNELARNTAIIEVGVSEDDHPTE